MTNWSRASAILGGVVWLLLFVAPPPGDGTLALIAQLLLLAVLVVTPLALSLAAPPAHAGRPLLLYQAALIVEPFAAASVVASFFLRPGVLAALLASGWLLLASLVALSGLFRFLPPRSVRADEACIVAGLLYLPVGAVWLLFARLGLRPLGFGDTIVILTAVHFHYAGFAAPILAGMAGYELVTIMPSASKLFRPIAVGVISGIALVAAGITLARFTPFLEVGAAVVFACSLLGLAALHLFVLVPALRGPARWLLAVSAASLVVAMLFAVGYAIGAFLGTPVVSIPQMVQIHGWANALGFVLCGLLAWSILRAEISRPDRRSHGRSQG